MADTDEQYPFPKHPDYEGIPATEKMPYGWWSPPWASRGWVGIIMLACLLGVTLGLTDLSWPWLILFTLVLLVGTELLRTDAIQQHGAVSFEFIRKTDQSLADHLYWPYDEDDLGGDGT